MSTYKGIAVANEAIVAARWYTAPSGTAVQIGDAVTAACAGTVSYSPDDLDRLSDAVIPGTAATRIEVTGESSMGAARRLHDEAAYAATATDHIAVLNVRYRLLESPYQVSFLTSPAPNAGVITRDRPADAAAIPDLLAARAGRVLATAARHGCRSLALGAWGCGVFRPPSAYCINRLLYCRVPVESEDLATVDNHSEMATR